MAASNCLPEHDRWEWANRAEADALIMSPEMHACFAAAFTALDTEGEAAHG